jgi:hypothetical protein
MRWVVCSGYGYCSDSPDPPPELSDRFHRHVLKWRSVLKLPFEEKSWHCKHSVFWGVVSFWRLFTSINTWQTFISVQYRYWVFKHNKINLDIVLIDLVFTRTLKFRGINFAELCSRKPITVVFSSNFSGCVSDHIEPEATNIDKCYPGSRIIMGPALLYGKPSDPICNYNSFIRNCS